MAFTTTNAGRLPFPLLQRLDVERLLRLGTIEAAGALTICFFVPWFVHDWNQPARIVVEVLLCLAAATVGRWPVPGAVATGLALTSQLALPIADGPTVSLFATFVPIISLGARGRNLLRALVTLWYLAVIGFLDSEFSTDPGRYVTALSGWAFLMVLACVGGSSLGVLLKDQESLRAAKTEALQAQRRSIARDLHDTVAYSTTLLVMRAEQAKLRGITDPAMLADLDFIITAGRNSIRDLRGMMQALRRNDPDSDTSRDAHSPWRIAPFQDVLAERTKELERHGFTVTTFVDADLSVLPDSVKETLGKVVVEATANMVKHAKRGSACSILIEATEREVGAVFTNVIGDSVRPAQSNHLGLIGLRERVEALGGHLIVTNTSPSWVVEVQIPLEG